ncbi:MAG: hypothetical protein K0U98_06235 [Deltaproteobacteria bacterium]|nr:hypothetical protein [Deltaproteobacteria bacterium]
MQADPHTDIPLDITQTWEGIPIAPEEQARVRLRPSQTDLWVEVEAPYYGDPAPTSPPGPTDQLWNFEVLEVFLVEAASLKPGRTPKYTEIELSPHGHYLVLHLEGIRNPVGRLQTLDFEVSRPDSPGRGSSWRGLARLPWAVLPGLPYRANAFALHGTGNQRRYLAHTPVPGDAPDFHRLASFPLCDLSLP